MKIRVAIAVVHTYSLVDKVRETVQTIVQPSKAGIAFNQDEAANAMGDKLEKNPVNLMALDGQAKPNVKSFNKQSSSSAASRRTETDTSTRMEETRLKKD